MNEEETLLDEFESAWLAGNPLSIEEFLQKHPRPDQDRANQSGAPANVTRDIDSLVAELVRLEFEYRFKESPQSPPSVQEYVKRYPELDLAEDLSQDERRLIRRFGKAVENDPLGTVVLPSNDGSTSAILKKNLLSGEGVLSGNELAGQRELASQQDSKKIASENAANAWFGLQHRFRQEVMLGEGSFGIVHRAYDRQLGREVAIKTLHPFLARDPGRRMALVHEARRAAKLDHPNLTTIHDVVVAKDYVHLVMKLADGLPMDVWWSQSRQNSNASTSPSDRVRTLAGLMAQVSRAVHHAHLAGLIHCDLKPQNILVDERNNPTVLDFGLAIQRSDQGSMAGRIFGTPAYMSPEQTWGEVHFLDGRSDIWSLGVILYRLLTGHFPFEAASTPHVLESIQTRSVTPPKQLNDDIPDAMSEICMRCLQKRIEDRYETAAELADAFQTHADEAISRSLVVSDQSQARRLIHCPFLEVELVGRDEIIKDVIEVLAHSNQRLLTLTGIGGSGKTQVAVAVAHHLTRMMQDTSSSPNQIDLGDVIWVDHANAVNGDQFAAAVLSGLGVAQQDDESSIERVGQILSVRGPVTLVFDNVEQIVDEAARLIGPWLAANPDLRLLVTSQVALRIMGERVVPIPPLCTHLQDGRDIDQASELFIRRAAAIEPLRGGIESPLVEDFSAIDDESKTWIQKIVVLLDGSPLAIELAAARVGVLTLKDLHKRLNQSFAVLKSRRPDRPDRHQSLTHVVAWSVDLLSPSKTAALQCLAIWPAPIAMQLAETMIELTSSEELPDGEREDAIEILDELRQRSLLRFRQVDGEMVSHADNAVRRYVSETSQRSRRRDVASVFIQQMLSEVASCETMPSEAAISRQHAATNLSAAVNWLGDDEKASDLAVRAVLLADQLAADQLDSHLRVERLRHVVPGPKSRRKAEWLYRLADANRLSGDTLLAEQRARELLDWLSSNQDLGTSQSPDQSTSDPNTPDQIAIEVDARRLLSLILFRSGRAGEAIELLEPMASLNQGNPISPPLRVEVILELIEYQRRLGHFDQAEQWLTQGHQILENSNLGSQLQTGLVIQDGKLALQRGQITQSRNHFDRALQSIHSASFEPKLTQQALLGRAAATAESGDYSAAELDYDRCERISRQLGDLPTLAQSLNNRALAADDSGDSQRACELLEQALQIYRRLGDRVGVAIGMAAQAAARLSLGQPERTVELLHSPEVSEHLPKESIHHAIRNGDLGVAYCQLEKWKTPRIICRVACLNWIASTSKIPPSV